MPKPTKPPKAPKPVDPVPPPPPAAEPPTPPPPPPAENPTTPENPPPPPAEIPTTPENPPTSPPPAENPTANHVKPGKGKPEKATPTPNPTKPDKPIGGGGMVPNAPPACTATSYAQIPTVMKNCKDIVLQDICAPPNGAILLTALKPGSTVIFAGETTFGNTFNKTFNPIVIGPGTDIIVGGAPGHIIKGNGDAYWDGWGSNGGGPKPNHFIVVKRLIRGVIKDLNIVDWPAHCFSITGCDGTVFQGIHLDNTSGSAPNKKSGNLPAAHNTDGFDASSCKNIVIQDCVVKNQDDCVAITSGLNYQVKRMVCEGGHGLSIGSVGGKSNNIVENVVFSDSILRNSENGCRIKSNSGTTGSITNILYQNIKLENMTNYGIDVQQDYLNGGPTGIPTNGVLMKGIHFSNVTGTMASCGKNYYVLCGKGSCTDFTFNNVKITGGNTASYCNFPASGCPA